MGWSLDHNAYRNQVLLATGGNDYGPQFGPANPPSYYYVAQILPCGHSEEDCDGRECGYWDGEVPPDYDFWLGTTPGREAELQYEASE